jgi:hypothetical protein
MNLAAVLILFTLPILSPDATAGITLHYEKCTLTVISTVKNAVKTPSVRLWNF